jgi:hypothetical protein
MNEKQTRWVVRLIPMPGSSVETLLNLSLGLDVWERHANMLVVAAYDGQLSELESRRLARVERLSTVAAFQTRAQHRIES